MFALKPRTEIAARALLIAVIVFNAFVPTAASASVEGENEKTPSATNANNDLANSITLGASESSVQEQVPVLSEQIAKQAQQQQDKSSVRFKIWAEPAIYTPGQPISLHWKVQNMKPEDLTTAAVVIHAPAGFTPTDPNPIYTPDGLVTIPLSSKKEVSEWNVAEGAALPIYFTLDLLVNNALIRYEIVMIDQRKIRAEQSKA